MLSWITTIIVTALVLIFALMNHAPVVLNLWPFSTEMELPAYFLVLVCFVIGISIGGFVIWLKVFKLKRMNRTLLRQIEDLKQENERLKPISSSLTTVPTVKDKA